MRAMRSLFFPAWALLSLLFLGETSVQAQWLRPGPISQTELGRVGLVRRWFTRLDMDSRRGRIVHITQHVSSLRSHTVFEVWYDNRIEAFSEHSVDKFGEPLGKQGAKDAAIKRNGELEAQKIKTRFLTREVPQVRLYVVTDVGTLHAIDGETGKRIWTVIVGNPDHPTTQAGASETSVAVVNGSNLFVLSAEKGEILLKRSLDSAAAAGPALGQELVYVPLVNGLLQAFSIVKPETPAYRFQGTGRAVSRPTATPNTLSWTTERGNMYVALADLGEVKYRVEALDAIVSSTAYQAPDRLFMGSLDGTLYCVRELQGDQIWRFTTGKPIVQKPTPIGRSVYAIAERGGLYNVNVESGQEVWWTPQVKEFLAKSESRIYVRDQQDRLAVLDAKSGARVATLADLARFDVAYGNSQTDRLFVASGDGTLQCLHEPQWQRPMVHRQVAETQPADAAEPVEEPMPEPGPADDNPFGAGAAGGGGPFPGGGDDEPNPFAPGGGDDDGDAPSPFAPGGGDDNPPNPFAPGAGGNPFGG